MQVQYVTTAAPWEQQHIHLEGNTFMKMPD